MPRGYDRAGAIDAYRKAAALDSKGVGAKVHLAVLLEHDEEGKRYGDPKTLLEAIAVYDAIDEQKLREYSEGAYVYNALIARMYAGKYDEIGQPGCAERRAIWHARGCSRRSSPLTSTPCPPEHPKRSPIGGR